MSVYVTGDCHGDFSRFYDFSYNKKNELNKNDIVVICGDFGLWHDDSDERWAFNWLNSLPFTTVFVDGNHSNFDRLYSDEFPIVDFHGGKAHKIRDSIYHLMRGYIFNFEGKKFFCMGGAKSHDIQDGILDPDDPDFDVKYKMYSYGGAMFRVNHVSWWKEEIPSFEEMEFARNNLAAVNYKVDYVIAHCLPHTIEVIKYRWANEANPVNLFFDDLLREGLDFKEWYCGHYHDNDRIMGKYFILYKRIVRIL